MKPKVKRGAKEDKTAVEAMVDGVTMMLIVVLSLLAIVVLMHFIVPPEPQSLQDACAAQMQRGGGDILELECTTYNCSSLRVIDVKCLNAVG